VQKWFQRSSPKNKSKEEFLATKQITVLEHPAYSPELTPMTFFLFPKVKKILKGRHFDDIDDVGNNTTAALKAIPQNQFQNCSEGWTRRWHRCIASQGNTLMAITVVFSNEICSNFTAMISGTLLSDHVYYPEKYCQTAIILTVPQTRFGQFLVLDRLYCFVCSL